ncbi:MULTISPECIES: helix-turn-helix domain-containing protein [Enterobacter cloacae complex]|uniref:helix-turn-helix domain-containing protein n=1 Tax=Enterobacter cloacae complex TaxID=354276 RepID=UPI003083385A
MGRLNQRTRNGCSSSSARAGLRSADGPKPAPAGGTSTGEIPVTARLSYRRPVLSVTACPLPPLRRRGERGRFCGWWQGFVTKGGEDIPVERMVFARNLRRARLARKLSQADVSRSTGVDKSYLSDIERSRANPSLDVMARLAHAVGADLCDLVCGSPIHRAPQRD